MDRRHGPFDVIGNLASLKRYARSLVRNNADAEDLVQDALVKAYERRGSFRKGANLRSWLFAILHNTHVDTLRSNRSRVRRDGATVSEAEHTIPASQEDIVHLRQVHEAFMRLPAEQREALHLVAVEDLSYQQAADTIGVPIGTLMSRVSRARATLRTFEQATTRKAHLRLVGGDDD
ncbi:sigma-70 family RNA polymerase sigma factor [Rhizobium sp. NFR07]|uniref:sigma-70 family RNA polymerase sigma factor n=1 Tax=Rhizobium sp. NFR07 TaxID=1566262 RepID=UPI000B8142BF|nr:sigma-70 family RNA polymerase sigma factor [Rhizobium sp. NFR07]